MALEIEENITNLLDTNEDNIIINSQEQLEHDININTHSSSYENIIELLGLNININYPINIIATGIKEMYMKSSWSENSYISKYSKCYFFPNNVIAKKLQHYILGYTKDHSVISYQTLLINLKRIYRQYKYNNIVSNVDNNDNKMKQNNVGFNYNNPRWNKLESIII
jgi:hypothetical protein